MRTIKKLVVGYCADIFTIWKGVYLFHIALYCSFLYVQIETHRSTVVFDSFYQFMSSLLSTSRVVSSVCYGVYFPCHFPIPSSISPASPIFMYSLYRLKRPGDNTQPCFTPLWIGKHSVVPLSTSTWLLILYVGLILTLWNALVLPYFLCFSKFWNIAHYQNPLCNL